MSDTVNAVKGPAALVVFGQGSNGGKHAAWFNADESAAARKAAKLQSFNVIEPIPAELTDVVSKIARGRMALGQISLTKANPDAYGKLLNHLEATRSDEPEQDGEEGEGGAEQGTSMQIAKPVYPASGWPGTEAWQQIKAGEIVLAPFYGAVFEGWWEARVISVQGDAVRLSWCDGTEGVVAASRYQLGLMFPRPA